MNGEELEAVCFNCNHFLPVPLRGPTEYGICLRNEVFEPFVEQLMEGHCPDACRELVENGRFHGGTEGCEHFEQCEMIEIDDNSHLAKALRDSADSGQWNKEAIERAMLLDQIDNIDWKTVPVDRYVAELSNSNKKKQLKAVVSLGGLITWGNTQAASHLLSYFKELPVPSTLDDVHFKREVFQYVERIENKSLVIPHLVNELRQIESNNTTRQWIVAILRYLQRCPIDTIRDPLNKLLQERKFSYRLRHRIEGLATGLDMRY